MKQTAFRWLGRSSVAAVAVAFASACAADTPAGPGRATAQGVTAAADVSDGNRLPDLAGCTQVGSTLVLHAYGIGVQIYQWNGTSWGFVAPSATLFADAGGQGVVATHFGGPTWQSNSGGTVVGTVAARCTVDPASIPWVSLTGVANGPGIFEKVTFIQRLNTVGGSAPSAPGNLNEVVKVPYTANYQFYKAP